MNINEFVIVLAYLIIYSFLGWILESVYKSIVQKTFVNSGFLYGPFCVIYGFGALIMYFFLDNFKDNILILFLAGVVVLSIWEYLVGFLLEKLFKTKYWDYSYNKFNFQGRICLQTSICWGILGTLFTTIIHPAISKAIHMIPVNELKYIVVGLTIYIIADTIFSVIKIKNLEIRIGKIKELEEILRSKLEELKTLKINSKKFINLNEIVIELRNKQDKLKYKISKQIKRFKNAFPSMKSEKISEFLNQRIEIFKNDKK